MFTAKIFAPHPEKLQETSALANATPLPHDYKLHLPLRTVIDCVTAAQLETCCPPQPWNLASLADHTCACFFLDRLGAKVVCLWGLWFKA